MALGLGCWTKDLSTPTAGNGREEPGCSWRKGARGERDGGKERAERERGNWGEVEGGNQKDF